MGRSPCWIAAADQQRARAETTDLLTLSKADFDRVLLCALGAGRIKSPFRSALSSAQSAVADWHRTLKLSTEFCGMQAGRRRHPREQPNDSFFLVYEGEFDVRKSGVSRATPGPAILRRDQFAPEHAATADVVAKQPGRCLKLAKDSFLRLVSQDFLTGLVIETTAETRVGERHAA